MIVDDVLKRVQRQFGDESSVQVTEEDVIRWINDGQKEIAVQNDLMQATGTLPTVIGVTDYAFPSDMLGLNKLFLDNVQVKYMSRNEYDLYVTEQDPQASSTGNSFVYTRWGNQLTLYPRPATVGTLKLFYTQRPPEVSSTADSLALPQEYHMRIVEYCLRMAYEMDEDWDAAAAKATQFDAGLSVLKESQNSPDREYYPTVTVLPDDM